MQSPDEFVLISLRGKLRLDEIGKALERFSKEEGDKPLTLLTPLTPLTPLTLLTPLTPLTFSAPL